VVSITRVGASPTNAATVQWTVTFSESVTGVNAADFTLVNSGLTNPGPISVTPVSGTVYTVSASTGTGSGTLGLNLVDDDTIQDPAGNRLGGTGTGNGNFTGQVYTIDKAKPSVTINQASGQDDPTLTQPVNFTAVFSEPINVSSFTSADVSVTGTALPATKTITITQIAPDDGTTFNVAISGITAAGTVIVSIPAGGVSDLVGNTNNASTSTDNQVHVGHLTTTSVTCSPSQLYTTRSTICTATVTDTSLGAGVAPDGTVSFTTSAGAGANFTPTSCTLTNPVANSTSCSVTYNTSTSTGTTTITASYAGSGITHGPSAGSTTLDVLPIRNDGDPATGGTVFLAGGSASAGSGFIETWWLIFQGNTGSYTGTGMIIGGDPQVGQYVPEDGPHCVFDPPVDDPDQYLDEDPPCTIPEGPPTTGTPTTTTSGEVTMDE
jgi:hypothetical protein